MAQAPADRPDDRLPDGPSPGPVLALIVDYGGVLTSPLGTTMDAWRDADEVDWDSFSAVMRDWLGARAGADAAVNPVHALEMGQLSEPDFERQLAARLRTRSGQPLVAQGLLRRMFAGFQREPDMIGLLRRVRARGLRVGLLSNSWGLDYPREDWAELFDDTVISGEVGLRKPQPEIYELAARRLGVAPAACVFVDDLPPNVVGAAAVGMVGIRHVDAATTAAELAVLLDCPVGALLGT